MTRAEQEELCGKRSNIPECCRKYFREVWAPFVYSIPQGKFNEPEYRKVFDEKQRAEDEAFGIPVGYVVCPECIEKARPAKVHVCSMIDRYICPVKMCNMDIVVHNENIRIFSKKKYVKAPLMKILQNGIVEPNIAPSPNVLMVIMGKMKEPVNLFDYNPALAKEVLEVNGRG
jgi:hypothetical protein